MSHHAFVGYADVVSSLAFLVAFAALAWNVWRDFVLDKVSIESFISFGEMGNIKNSSTGIFADAGSLLPQHKFDEPSMLVQIINTGRRPIGIANIGGKYKNGAHFHVSADGLPKMLQPYEVFSTSSNAKIDFIKKVDNDEVEVLWISDTKGKDWYFSERALERMRRTANYIASGKHL